MTPIAPRSDYLSAKAHRAIERFRQTLSKEHVSARTIQRFQNTIYYYYDTHGRDLPWRKATDPYAILVSEIMLQQTQAERVIQKYHDFLAAFPDFSSLAGAGLQEILNLWLGLGYNRRALALKKIAQVVCNEFNGMLPASEEDLRTLPGVGRYTTAAIVAFAFNLPVVLLETNVRAVFIHFFFDDGVPVHDDEVTTLIEKTLDRSNPRRWYNALIDYGAMLKREYPNPGRRSLHYKNQSPFMGSDRRIRGMILRFLTKEGPRTARAISEHINEDAVRVKKILGLLENDGLIRKVARRFSIS